MLTCALTMPVGFRLLSRRLFRPNSDESAMFSHGTIMMVVGFFGYMAALYVFTEWKGLEKVSWWFAFLGYLVAFVFATMAAFESVDEKGENQHRGGLSSSMTHTLPPERMKQTSTVDGRGWMLPRGR